MERKMIETIEIRRASNGYILAINDADVADQEFVYDSSRKLMRELRKLCERMEGAAAFEAKRAALKD
jgi:hypothetical protein|tara:strand:- start:4 stop:204 length:201 start_codon:yes stop_codon:yes gene_type:complete